MPALDFEAVARAAQSAADAARRETIPRFRRIGFETSLGGLLGGGADCGAERAIRRQLRESFPDFGIVGEEFGEEGADDRPRWVVDPIDGTIAFSRGIPLYTTLIALLEEGEPVFGLIDCPLLDERYLGWRGGGCQRNGEPTHVSAEEDLARAIVSHGDPFCFDLYGAPEAFERLARECKLLRGYTDAFGHAQVLGGGVAAMVDLNLNLWDAAPSLVLVPEAGGRIVQLPEKDGKIGLVFGGTAIVEKLLGFFD
ncbi:MAG: inositol monophosphatase family protein [Myxococcota bacterium]